MVVPAFIKTVMTAPYYRRHWLDAVRELNTAVQFKRHRIERPEDFLAGLGIDREAAFSGFDRWRPLLKGAIEAVEADNGRQGGCSLEDGMILYGIVRALRPQVVIETGVAAGVSTSFLGAAMVDNGRGTLYSLELPPVGTRHVLDDGVLYGWAETGVGWAIPAEVRSALGHRHVLILEDVRTSLPRLIESVGPIDVFFHDDLHTPDHMRWQYHLVWPHIAPGGILASDDANVAWIDFCVAHGLRAERFPNLQRLTAVRKPALLEPAKGTRLGAQEAGLP